MQISRILARTIALAGLAVVGVSAAHAQSITPVFNGSTGSAGDVTYTYLITSTADTKTQAGDVFTFYDFNGLLTSGADAPTFTSAGGGTAYNITVQNLGLNPANTSLLATDDPTKPNVSLTYTGTTFINSSAGSETLGTLVLHSQFVQNTVGNFTPFAANATKNSNGTASGNQGFVSGPNVAPPPTPEPGTWAMFVGMGVTGLAVVRRKRRI